MKRATRTTTKVSDANKKRAQVLIKKLIAELGTMGLKPPETVVMLLVQMARRLPHRLPHHSCCLPSSK